MSSWRWICSGAATGAFNMATDEVLLLRAGEAVGAPVLRFFTWDPPAVTLGYAQKAGRELDLCKCRDAGIDIVRRLTGGRAVLHWNELTYSLVWPHGGLGNNMEESFHLIGRCLVAGLRRFGVDATLEKSQSGRARQREPHLSPPCFASTSRWEVKYQGRKLVGSAQRRMKRAVLQHGSLLLGPQHKKLLDLLPGNNAATRQRRYRELDAGSVDLQSWGAGEIDPHRLARCLAEGFAECAGVRLRRDELDFSESEAIGRMVETRYGNPAWNRTPARAPTEPAEAVG